MNFPAEERTQAIPFVHPTPVAELQLPSLVWLKSTTHSEDSQFGSDFQSLRILFEVFQGQHPTRRVFSSFPRRRCLPQSETPQSPAACPDCLACVLATHWEHPQLLLRRSHSRDPKASELATVR